jgi:hypothetical protein
VRLELDSRVRELALFNIGIDSQAVSRPALGSERWMRHVDQGRSFDETRALAVQTI